MALPRITQKEMTEREQRELKTLLDRARIAHGRPLSNAETNSVKKEYIDKLMAQLEQVDQLIIGQIAPLSQRDPRQADVHNPRTLKLRHFIAKVLAHATDLAV